MIVIDDDDDDDRVEFAISQDQRGNSFVMNG